MQLPVLILTYNRPLIVLKLIKSLKTIKPKNLYIASDGPKASNLSDYNLVEETRAIIKNEIDAAAEVAIVEITVPNIAPHIIPDTNKKNIAIGINITMPNINKKQKIRIER